MVSNKPSVTMPTTSTTSVEIPLCTNTLSTTSWKKIGVASANNCTNSDATSTWASGRRYRRIEGQNQRNPKVVGSTPVPPNRRVIRTSSPEDSAATSSIDNSCAVLAF